VSASSGTVTVTEALPSGLSLVSMSGTGWTCVSTSCTRGDALAGGSSYPAITVMVNVAANASSPQLNQVGVTGGGSAMANASDSTVVAAVSLANPVLSISKSHTGNFTQGQQNASYTVTVSNANGVSASSGTVTVTEALPSGLSLVSMSGTGWTCVSASCTRADALAGGNSYPSITVMVNVAANASSPQLNQVSVAGGGSAMASASDSTVVAEAGGSASSSATFVKLDATTQGSWEGTYGSDGYQVIGDLTLNPSYVTPAVTGENGWTWASSTSDVRALQKASNPSDRIAGTWYSTSSFTVDLNIEDGKTHEVALYCVDWDTFVRRERVDVLDGNGNLLDTQNLNSSFHNGVYLVWNLSGHVKLRVTLTGGANAVASGLFFH
jgi:uncharacterized repeat protein (TIGR01451 family)